MQEILSSADTALPHASPTWYRAYTLAERARQNPEPERPLPNIEQARVRLLAWQAQKPFEQEAYFAQRLAQDGLSQESFLALLAREPGPGEEQRSDPPAWMAWLDEALASLDTTERAEGEENPREFAAVAALLLKRGLLKIRSGIIALAQKHARLPFSLHNILLLLISHIPGYIDPRLHKTVILELNVARIQGRLQGNSAEERFGNFLRQLRRPAGLQALLAEYPVLARLLVEAIEQWANCELELLERLCADWAEICARFTPARDPGTLARIFMGQGDLHRGGQSTTILEWSCGWRLVYKPHSLAVDAHFQQLLTWLNECGCQPAFRTFQVLDKGVYGWVEFVHTGPCASQAEVERFYKRQGGYLALLYALEATDFHAENLVAAGEHPILVDLEALFHPRLASPPDRPEHPGSRAINHSVLRVGMLPQRIWANEESDGVDISSLGGLGGQLSPTPVARWVGAGTDHMHVKWERTELLPQHHFHRPRLREQEVNTLDYREAVVAGFTTVYRLLLRERETLVEQMLPRFAQDEIRCVLRPTRIYDMLLRDSFHPNVLRDALDRACLLDRLWVGIEKHPHFARIIPAEQRDLGGGDIPIFTTHADSCDLLTSRQETITGFFAEAGLAMAGKRIAGFDEQDLQRQIWVIQASFTSLLPHTEQEPHVRLHLKTMGEQVNACVPRLQQAAQAIGDHLCTLALRDVESGAAGWLGISPLKEREWHLVPAGLDLYDGLPGIALFLASLSALTGEERYQSLARQALSTLRGLVAEGREQPVALGVGAFSGWGSVIYTLSHLGHLWHEPALYQEAAEIVQLLPAALVHDTMLDVVGGAAGCIAALLSLYSVAPSEQIRQMAISCGDHLREQARPMPVGCGWIIKGEQEPLTGFAHGNAGIALSLLRLWALSGAERFRHLALAALAYERSLFLPGRGNWPDLRKATLAHTPGGAQRATMGEDDFPSIAAWCHGAPGIGLARLACLQFVDDAEGRAEIEAATRTTLTAGFGRNHSLCHGDLGNLELLLEVVQRFPEPRLQTLLKQLTSALLDSIEQQGWITGVPQGIETPGLMVGLAGSGYALLRLAMPARVPSVLLLAPPVQPLT
ncbi:MAG TPA: type 2 lanthipeptide synthetase LanM family protein [Ktedonobacteraceae bacterium]|jgi:type 2 lantibiotic biosynthesis protein LanM